LEVRLEDLERCVDQAVMRYNQNNFEEE